MARSLALVASSGLLLWSALADVSAQGNASAEVEASGGAGGGTNSSRPCSMKELYGLVAMNHSEAEMAALVQSGAASCTPGMKLPKPRPCSPSERGPKESEEVLMAMLLNGSLSCLPSPMPELPELPDCRPEQYLKILKTWPSGPSGAEMAAMRLNGSWSCMPSNKSLPKLPACSAAQMGALVKELMAGASGSAEALVADVMGGMRSLMAGLMGANVGLKAGVSAGAGGSASGSQAGASGSGSATVEAEAGAGGLGSVGKGSGKSEVNWGPKLLEMMVSGNLSCTPTEAVNATVPPAPERLCSLQELAGLGQKSPQEVAKMMAAGTLGCKLSFQALSNISLPGLDLSKLPACSEKDMEEMGKKGDTDLVTMAFSGQLKCLPSGLAAGGKGSGSAEGSAGGSGSGNAGGSAGGNAGGGGGSGQEEESRREAPPKEVKSAVGKFLAGCKEASCLAKAADALSSGASGLSAKAQKTFLNQFAAEAAKDAAKEGVKDCLAPGKSTPQKEACFKAAREALGAATEALLGNRTAEVKAKVQQEMAKEAAREAVGEASAGCLVGAAKATCLAQIKADLAAAGLADENERNIRDGLFRKKMREASEDCSNSTCRQAAKQAALDAGMEERQYASLKALADIRAAAEIYGNCQLAGSGESECMGMARAEFVASSGARVEDFSAELQARVRNLGEAIVNGVPVIMVRLQRLLASVVASASSCDVSVEDWFARTCLSRAQEKESRAESAEKRKCIVVDAKVQYSAFVKVSLAEEEMEALAAHVAGHFEGKALVSGAARRLGDSALRRLSTVSESYASQDVAECSETDSACREGSSETGTTPKPGSEPASAAAGAGLGALAALAAALALWQ